MRSIKFLGWLMLIVIVASCKKGKNEAVYSKVPYLELTGQSTDEINYMDTAALLNLRFIFTDGDGDIAQRDPSVDSSIVVLIMREGDTSNTRHLFPMPQVDRTYFQKNGGIRATMQLDLPYYFFYPRQDPAHSSGLDTMNLGIYIQDYAGNKSDTIIVGPIYSKP